MQWERQFLPARPPEVVLQQARAVRGPLLAERTGPTRVSAVSVTFTWHRSKPDIHLDEKPDPSTLDLVRGRKCPQESPRRPVLYGLVLTELRSAPPRVRGS